MLHEAFQTQQTNVNNQLKIAVLPTSQKYNCNEHTIFFTTMEIAGNNHGTPDYK